MEGLGMDAVVTAPLTLIGALVAGYLALMAGKWMPRPMHDAIVSGLLARIEDRDQAIAYRDRLLEKSEQEGAEWLRRYLDSQDRLNHSVKVMGSAVTVIDKQVS